MSIDEPKSYRMKMTGFVWHFDENCDQFPENNYKEITIREPHEFMMVCIKCKRLQVSLETKKPE